MLRKFLSIVVLLSCASLAFAQAESPRRVVSKIKLSLKQDGKLVDFALAGEMMTVQKTKPGSVFVQTAGGQEGWLAEKYVVGLEEADKLFTELIKEEPKDDYLYINRAMVWTEKGETKKAIADYSKAIDLKTKNVNAWINRGVAYAATQEYDKAIADYDAVLKAGHKKTGVYLNRAFANMAKNDAEAAIKDLTEALKLDPSNLFIRQQRGVMYQRKQDYDKAIRDFSDVLKRDKKHLGALSSRGFTHYLKQDWNNAIKDFDQVIKIDPDSGLAYNNRGFNKQKKGDYKGAVADYKQATEKAPKYALAWQNYAWLLATCPKENVRDGKKAIDIAKTACELREWKVASDIKALAAAHAEAGSFDRAVEYQTKVVSMMEGDAKSGEEEILKLYKAKAPYRFTDG